MNYSLIYNSENLITVENELQKIKTVYTVCITVTAEIKQKFP